MPESIPSKELNEISDSGLFDYKFYMRENPDVQRSGMDALDHYCTFGWREGRRPNPYFDGAWYLEQHPDVLLAAMNPLLHYIRHGDREGRRPVPIFDTPWYRTAYNIPSEQLALRHFLVHRHGGRALPSPELFTALHIPPFATLAARGEDPFETFGALNPPSSPLAIETGAIRHSGLFDENYYLLNGSDLLDIDIEPALHFCRWGWREHRKPNIYFDTGWYLATNSDVARLSINPLAHYIFEGELKGRRPAVYFDPIWYRGAYEVPKSQNALGHYLERRRLQIVSPNCFFNPTWYVENHGTEVGPGRDAFAHYLYAGTYRDINPSADFDAIGYRHRHLGRPSRLFKHLADPQKHNPLVHFLRSSYR